MSKGNAKAPKQPKVESPSPESIKRTDPKPDRPSVKSRNSGSELFDFPEVMTLEPQGGENFLTQPPKKMGASKKIGQTQILWSCGL